MNDCAFVQSVYDKAVLELQFDCKTVSVRLVSVLCHSAQVKVADRDNG